VEVTCQPTIINFMGSVRRCSRILGKMNGVRAADILELHGEKLTSSASSEYGQLNINPFAIFK